MLVDLDTEKGETVLIQNPDKYIYAGEIWPIKITAVSVASQSNKRTVSIQFTIEWKDPCTEAELFPALFGDTPLEMNLYSVLKISYSSMEHVSDVDCGGYTNQFKYVDGPAKGDTEP